jgi:signal transduction histidine kinase
MMTSPEVKIFAMAPSDKKQRGVRGFFGELVLLGSAPKILTGSIIIAADTLFVVWALLIVFNLQHGPLVSLFVVEGLFLISAVAFFLAHKSVHVPTILAYNAIVVVLSIVLNLFFSGNWGDLGIYALCGYAIYRFPLRWAFLMIVLPVIALVVTHHIGNITKTHGIPAEFSLLSPLLIVALIGWVAWTRRARHLLIVELQMVQAQLRAQIARTEELATARERARIARDIHDVLAHTLTILSIQVQAARQLVLHNPEKLATKLDDMAALLRESIAESRRVVGLLRETALSPASLGDMGTRLQAMMERFSERSGIRCVFEEEGTSVVMDDKQGETLQFALQEALTNAHRHGAATMVKATLSWQPKAVTMSVLDNGQGSSKNTDGSHEGLHGMRERTQSLGGSLETSSLPEGGFAVTLSLPLHSSQSLHSTHNSQPLEMHRE